ncbi:hypothetical protein BT93_L1354 [Corymbia citriodora subsp. variegata]|uniref:Thiamine pyrophosphokinase n=1 Tax=Corymbia citriodora subsp. variegata TaxID=360336 RepID=A0A8T0CFA5_CORYI|nr:hypothetical protein BT93_L1354 [Corymbia citriodora subsp. variegata]
MTSNMKKEWWPTKILQQEASTPYAIVVLNVQLNEKVLSIVVNNASLLVCADAGADRYRAFQSSNNAASSRRPDVIIGDLDSVSEDTLNHYRSQGVVITKDPDQYSSDLTKSLKWIRNRFSELYGTESEADVLVVGSLSGRVDQAFSQVHHLYLADHNTDLLRGNAYLLSDTNISFLLSQGLNRIHVSRELFDEACGVLPIAGRTVISMTGFEWDVVDWPTEFGGQISTSQYWRSDLLQIEVKGPNPLFTLELAKAIQG